MMALDIILARTMYDVGAFGEICISMRYNYAMFRITLTLKCFYMFSTTNRFRFLYSY